MKISEEQKDKVIIILLISIIILSIMLIIKVVNKDIDKSDIKEQTLITEVTESTTKEIDENYYVDIKGAVKKPGVYEVSNSSIVNDVIKLAGGLKSNAYTGNINLSQKTHKEMVIYIYTTTEIKKLTTTTRTDTSCTTNVIEVNNCITTSTSSNTNSSNTIGSNKVNINTATKEELLTLSGIGESKAKSIIEYRQNNKFTTIEDIKNVSGIGEALYDSIKDDITV